MKRLVTAMVAVLLVLSSCGGGAEDASTTASSTTVRVVTTLPPSVASTTAGAEPPVTFPPDPHRGLPVIVTAADGVYEVAGDGSSRKLLDGEVSLAIDDTRGGLLYQIDRGRRWSDRGPKDTRIWWLRAGSSTPQDILVPTGSEGHELSLHDAYYDDGLHVIYSRHEGVWTEQSAGFDFVDRLRTYDVARSQVTELVLASAWEAGIGFVQCGDDLIAYTEYNQIGSNCEFVDHAGAPVSIPADIEAEACEIDCRRQCAIGWDGELLMYTQDHLVAEAAIAGTTVFFVDSQTAVEIERVVHLSPGMQLDYIDLLGNRVLISVRDGPGVIYDLANLSGVATTLPIAGTARFARAPIEVPSIVTVA